MTLLPAPGSLVLRFLICIYAAASLLVSLWPFLVGLLFIGNFSPHQFGHWIVGAVTFLSPFAIIAAYLAYQIQPGWTRLIVSIGCSSLVFLTYAVWRSWGTGIMH